MATSWSSGTPIADLDEIAVRLTQRLFVLGWQYETRRASPLYGQPLDFDLQSFVSHVATPPPSWQVNCFDTGHALVSSGASLGIPMSYRQWGSTDANDPFNKLDHANNVIQLIGWPADPTNAPLSGAPPLIEDDCRPTDHWFGNHAWAMSDTSRKVFDATMLVDTDTEPDNVSGPESPCLPGLCGTVLSGSTFVTPVRLDETAYQAMGWDPCPGATTRFPGQPFTVTFVTNPIGQ